MLVAQDVAVACTAEGTNIKTALRPSDGHPCMTLITAVAVSLVDVASSVLNRPCKLSYSRSTSRRDRSREPGSGWLGDDHEPLV